MILRLFVMEGVGELDKVVASPQIALEGLEDGAVVLVGGFGSCIPYTH